MKSERFSKLAIYFLVTCLCFEGVFFDLEVLASEMQSEENSKDGAVVELLKTEHFDEGEELENHSSEEGVTEEDREGEGEEERENDEAKVTEEIAESGGAYFDELDESPKLLIDEMDELAEEVDDGESKNQESTPSKDPPVSSGMVVDFINDDLDTKEGVSEEVEGSSGEGIIINEVMIGQVTSSKNEFIELLNISEETIDLDDWKLTKKTASGNESNLISKSKFSGEIKPGEFFVIKHPKFDGLEEFNAVYSGSSYSIAKDNSIVLYNSESDVVDLLCWGDKQYECKGISFSENPGDGLSLARKESSGDEFLITREPTPGSANVFPEKEVFSKLVGFSEIVPNPEGVDRNNEWVEIVSSDSNRINFSGWSIMNGSGKVFRIDAGAIERFGFFVVEIKEAGSFSVRNSNEQLSLLNPNMEKVASVLIPGSSRSGLSYNRNGSDWGWSRYLTPGKINLFNSPPQINIKKVSKAYKNIYVEFDASKTRDANGEELKFKWNFGDGHYSYLKKTKHKYKKKGKYIVILEVDDGIERVYKEIKIEVKSFPKYELRITRLLPNPKGRDSGNEVVSIYNYYKKSLNLKGYKLATGRDSSHLVNHPIYEDFKIKSGKSKDLKNKKICKYSLLNKKGVVALLYPSGKIADIVSYEKDKITDDEEFVLQGRGAGHWTWVEPEKENEGNIIPVMTKGASSELGKIKKTPYYIFATRNEKELMCECARKLKIENWKHQNKKISMLIHNPSDITLFKIR